MGRTQVALRLLIAVGILATLTAAVVASFHVLGKPRTAAPLSAHTMPVVGRQAPAPVEPEEDRFFANGGLTVWWDRETLPGQSTVALTKAPAGGSNIHPTDYAGAESCRKCHPKNYAGWSKHPHRWMNTLAKSETVKGDFSDDARISYLGGVGRFGTTESGEFVMELQRGEVRRRYRITQTIGSRFFQYYVGKLAEGPEPAGHFAYRIDHVLPFGYWLDRREWVPVVHVGYDEAPDGKRDDPFAANAPNESFSPYYQCNSCHTTFPLGDELTRNFHALGRHAPFPLHWSMPDYVSHARSDLLNGDQPPRDYPNQEVERLMVRMQSFSAPERAASLGITCEACHLGCEQHVTGAIEKPSFFPYSPFLHADTPEIPAGRHHDNVNWTCGRCHAGERPYYAGGMSTWNSTEYTDASKGHCYSQLECIDCHDPHQATGSKWTRSAAEDDASCLKCHQQFQAADALTQHTHHPAGGAGSRCMNCHMPRLNEGLQNVVRTHTIFSPTKPEMIEANHLNACNVCHVEQPIDWTLEYLRRWYGAEFSESKIASNYPHRDGPVAAGWLTSDNEAVRLAATDAVARSSDRTVLPELIDVLDDPYLLNRQFARIGLEQRFDIRLLDFGYRFYMTPEERREPVLRIRRHLLGREQE